MKLSTLIIAIILSAFTIACSQPEPVEAPEGVTESRTEPEPESTTEPETVALTTEEMAETLVDLNTSEGTITIRFFPEKAPNHVRNFISLAEQNFYDGTRFHRVIPGFMIQGGDPNTIAGAPHTWGMGGSGKNIEAEFNDVKHERGIVSAARSADPDSASSQFFIMVAAAPALDGKYSAFGEVVHGMDVVDEIVAAPRDTSNDRPFNPVTIEGTTVRTESAEAPGPEDEEPAQ